MITEIFIETSSNRTYRDRGNIELPNAFMKPDTGYATKEQRA